MYNIGSKQFPISPKAWNRLEKTILILRSNMGRYAVPLAVYRLTNHIRWPADYFHTCQMLMDNGSTQIKFMLSSKLKHLEMNQNAPVTIFYVRILSVFIGLGMMVTFTLNREYFLFHFHQIFMKFFLLQLIVNSSSINWAVCQ